MANLSGIARPYALAAFEYAHEKQQLSDWKAFLETASSVTKDKAVIKLLNNTEFTKAQLLELYEAVLSSTLNAERKNFLHLLAQSNRLNVLPEIASAFNLLCAALEKTSTVHVVTAVEAEQAFKEKLIQALTKRLKRDVTLECSVDPSLIGGAVIRIGDRVIDGSVRETLSRLRKSLSA